MVPPAGVLGGLGNFVWAAERARWLAGRVAEHFAAGAEVGLPDLRFDDQGMAAKVNPLEQPEVEKVSARSSTASPAGTAAC